MIEQSRRDALRIASVMSLAFAAGILKPSDVFAAEWNAKAFDAKTLADALKELGATGAADSKDVALNGPDIAENGAVVPVSVVSSLPKTEFVAILVDKNPQPLAASFKVLDGSEAAFTTRIKMGTTSQVHALVKADGKWFVAGKEIKVTLGGCGG